MQSRRFRDLMLDIIVPLPDSHGMRYCLTVIDRTSRFVDALPIPEATAANCADAFIAQWVSRFGIPETATCDNGNTFVSNLWSKLHENLGTVVKYTPVYSPASLGGLERQHRDIKSSLRAVLHHMGDTHGSNWLRVLPWILLGRRAAYQPDLGTSPAEIVLGETPLVPGQLVGTDLHPEQDLQDLLTKLQIKAARPPQQTSHHGNEPTVHLPKNMTTATHVYVRRHKVSPLGKKFDGPFPITKRLGDACIQVRVAYYANGKPREELHHWKNCKVAYFLDEPFEATKGPLGRPKANHGSEVNATTTVFYDTDRAPSPTPDLQRETETDDFPNVVGFLPPDAPSQL